MNEESLCPHTEHVIAWSLGEPLDVQNARKLEDHLKECGFCAAERSLVLAVDAPEQGTLNGQRPRLTVTGEAVRIDLETTGKTKRAPRIAALALAASLGTLALAFGWLSAVNSPPPLPERTGNGVLRGAGLEVISPRGDITTLNALEWSVNQTLEDKNARFLATVRSYSEDRLWQCQTEDTTCDARRRSRAARTWQYLSLRRDRPRSRRSGHRPLGGGALPPVLTRSLPLRAAWQEALSFVFLGALLGMVALFGGVAEATAESLTLRIEDTSARPGGTAVIVVRTYTPRPVGSGQMCFRLRRALRTKTTKESSSPVFDRIDQVIAFSPSGQGLATAQLQTGVLGQEILLDLAPDGDVNQTDGPVLAIVGQLSAELEPGEVVLVEFDEAQTVLNDPQENPLPLKLRSGELEILEAGAPVELELELHSFTGDQVRIRVETHEPLNLSSLALFVDLPADLLAAPLSASAPWQQGDAVFQVNTTTPQPGTVRYAIEASPAPPGASPGPPFSEFQRAFGELPGDLIEWVLPLADGPLRETHLALGENSELLLIGGSMPAIDPGSGVSFVSGGGLLFWDDFERTGTLAAWSRFEEALSQP